jgi:hypothetical protein
VVSTAIKEEEEAGRTLAEGMLGDLMNVTVDSEHANQDSKPNQDNTAATDKRELESEEGTKKLRANMTLHSDQDQLAALAQAALIADSDNNDDLMDDTDTAAAAALLQSKEAATAAAAQQQKRKRPVVQEEPESEAVVAAKPLFAEALQSLSPADLQEFSSFIASTMRKTYRHLLPSSNRSRSSSSHNRSRSSGNRHRSGASSRSKPKSRGSSDRRRPSSSTARSSSAAHRSSKAK